MIKINGIQQIGVGVENLESAFKWYRENFGMDIKVFDEEAVAEFMLPHTGGQKRERHAILAMNMEGGGGFEIWQHTGKKPQPAEFQIQLGDLGICITKMKTADAQKAYDTFKNKGLNLLTSVTIDPAGTKHFYVKDVFNNVWEFVEHSYIFTKVKSAVNGGALGVVIGTTDIEASRKVYSDILGYNTVVYDKTANFEDWQGIPGAGLESRRVLLHRNYTNQGAFSPLLGPSVIELVQVNGYTPKSIFEGRIWGDPGFIQICYDIVDMNQIREEVKQKGFPFTVDSSTAIETFDMGEAAGNFAYIQAPEGTLIEFVETLKVPLIKKLGLVIDLRKRGQNKPLPRWLLKLFSTKRVK